MKKPIRYSNTRHSGEFWTYIIKNDDEAHIDNNFKISLSGGRLNYQTVESLNLSL
jgi:hypothetical protein